MISALTRKAQNLMRDPALRRWVIARLLGQVKAPPPFRAHRPPYLADMLPLPAETPTVAVQTTPVGAPSDEIALPLPGKTVTVSADNPGAFFDDTDDDIETALARHRFAWLPLLIDSIDPAWVTALWDAWQARFGTPGDGWAWHPYTAAERAVNLLDFVRRQGAPADAAAALALHAPAIAGRLEYFGEHDTSNHLCNNGRGLYRLGAELGLSEARRMGFAILTNEADRILGPGGVLREGSSHYQYLYARNFADVWLSARRMGYEDEAAALARHARATAAAAQLMAMPGGLPLIGDISPDVPPRFLVAPEGWMRTLPGDERDALADLLQGAGPDPETVARSGWHRVDRAGWHALAFVAPGGWPPMPGHAHQDFGSAEVHLGEVPVFVDPGRGAYGETGDAALYRSAAVHGTLTIDGEAPYPVNKPYYDDAFRTRLCGGAPTVENTGDRLIIRHGGFRRLGGVGEAQRTWHFESSELTVEDKIDGKGKVRIERALVTPLHVAVEDGGAILRKDGLTIRLFCSSGALTVSPVTLWRAYGEGRPGSLIRIEESATLPWRGRISAEVVA